MPPSGWTRRGVLAQAAAFTLGARAAEGAVPIWIAQAENRPPAPAAFDARALFLEALRMPPPASPDVAPLFPAVVRGEAQAEVAAAVRLLPEARAQFRLALDSRITLASYRAVLDCRTLTSIVLPLQGEGGWAEPGLHSLRSAVRRCARDVLLLVATELGMRQRGYWQPRVEALRLEEIESPALPPDAGHAFLVLRETDPALFLAATQEGSHGVLRDARLILDKPLVTEWRRVAA